MIWKSANFILGFKVYSSDMITASLCQSKASPANKTLLMAHSAYSELLFEDISFLGILSTVSTISLFILQLSDIAHTVNKQCIRLALKLQYNKTLVQIGSVNMKVLQKHCTVNKTILFQAKHTVITWNRAFGLLKIKNV